MAVFPQLVTGASAIYPVIRRSQARTVVNSLDDGRAVVYSDPDGGRREWELRASGLTENERADVEALFVAMRGKLETFTFLDPAGNLLARSEEFSDPVWAKGALVALTPGVTDPFGTLRATQVVNTGAAAGSISQVVEGPGSYQYSMSVWARSAGGAGISLRAGSLSRTVGLDATWKRYSMPVALGVASSSVTFGVELPEAVAVDLFGMQVEAQVGVSDYKKTGARGGVYLQARFRGDELVSRAQGSDVFDAVVGVVAL
jgi:hypothetical protein